MKIFGFNIVRDNSEEEILSPIEPQNEDGALSVAGALGGAQGMFLDLDGDAKTEADLIQRYRTMMRQPEVQYAVDDIINEAIYIEDGTETVSMNLDNLELSDKVKKKIQEEFKNVLKLLKFNTQGYDIFSKWYVDGRLNYQVIIDPNAPEAGIKELRYIDPRKIKKIREYEVRPLVTDSGINNINTKKIKNEYYMYSERGFGSRKTNNHLNESIEGLRLAKDSIIHANSGVMNETATIVLSHLDKAYKPLNQLRIMEDATVIYRVSRAPERRAFYIDVGNLPKLKAEQYLRDMMVKHKNKIVYNSETGEMRDDRRVMTMTDDYWLPRREGGKGTQIDTLQGGSNLGEMEDVLYFQKRLYKSLNVPLTRMDQESGFSFGRGSEVTRDEVKFAKFVTRLRVRFSMIFDKALEKQLILKNIIRPEEWEELSSQIVYDFHKDNYFDELKEFEILREKLQLVQEIEQFEGKYYSREWVRKKVLMQSDEDIKTIDDQIADEKEKYGDEEEEYGFGDDDKPKPKPKKIEEPKPDDEDEDGEKISNKIE